MSPNRYVVSIVQQLRNHSSTYLTEASILEGRAKELFKKADETATDADALEALIREPSSAPDTSSDAPMTSVAAFGINEAVKLRLSGEAGTVIGIATFKRSPMSYQVEYLGNDGRHSHDWFDADSLERA